MTDLAIPQREMTEEELDRYNVCNAEMHNATEVYLNSIPFLREIHDFHLWRTHYSSFKEFVEVEHTISKQHAYRLMDHDRLNAHLSTKCNQLVASETISREILRVKEPEKQITVWNKLLKLSAKKKVKITAKLATEVISDYLTPKTTTVVTDPPDDAIDVSTTGDTEQSSEQDVTESVTHEPAVNDSLQTGTAGDIEAEYHLPAGTLTYQPVAEPVDDPTAAEGDKPAAEDDDVVLSRKAIRGLIKHVMPKISEHAHVVDRVLRAVGKPGIDLEAMGKHQDAIITAFEAAKRDLQ